jgi:hypothetical protein
MSDDKNVFGGANATSLYIPISEIEQEFISRLIESNEMLVMVHGWRIIPQPLVTFGDKNLHIAFKLPFDKPENPTKLYYLDLELKTLSGISLYRQKMSTLYNHEPLMVGVGVELDMVWDIALKSIDPKLIKSLMPSITGLTSRLQDKDSLEMTLSGNMKLNKDQLEKARLLEEGERKMKIFDHHKLKGKIL